MLITLTGKQIANLAEIAGLQIDDRFVYDEDVLEIEIVVMENNKDFIENEEGEKIPCKLFAYYAEYPEEGVSSLDI